MPSLDIYARMNHAGKSVDNMKIMGAIRGSFRLRRELTHFLYGEMF